MSRHLKSLFALLPVALLAACNAPSVQPPGSYNLSGHLSGDWGTQPHLRLALVGTGLPHIFTNDSTEAQNIVESGPNSRSFGFDLPHFPNVVGAYQVVAFDDANNNAKYDIGENVARNRQWLIYSPSNTTTPALSIPAQFPWAAGEEALPALQVTRGWNIYDRTQPLSSVNPRPAGQITNYDLFR